MAFTPIDPAPPRTSPLFEPYVDNYHETVFPNFVTELSEVVTAFNNGAHKSASTTSVSIDLTANKVFTVDANCSFVKGMTVSIISTATADTNNRMTAIVRSYVGTTLAVDPVVIFGSGTIASWMITIVPPINTSLTNHWAKLETGNGYGSTNTRVRNFTTTSSSGSACTPAVNATLGATITINATGLYLIEYGEANPTVTGVMSITLNSTQLNLAPTITSQIASRDITTGNIVHSLSRSIRLVNGDVLRAQASVTTITGTTGCYFTCEQLRT